MRLRILLLAGLLARLAAAQAPDTIRRAPRATVSGVVRDSITRTPLAGAIVQLIGSDTLALVGRGTTSDSLGRFSIGDVPAGRYAIGFFHPLLDSLGLEPTLREVDVVDHRPVRADLGTPSPKRLRAAICGMPPAPGSGAVLVGIVRNAGDGTPVAGVTVTGEWTELTVRREGVARRVPRLVSTTWANGWFALCNVPGPGTIMLTASRGADSTDVIETQVPAGGFLRRELFLGPARTVVSGDTTPGADPLAPPPRRLHGGDGRLGGTVVTEAEGAPLAGAQVSIAGGPQTRANERGEWTLVGLPLGSRMLEIRAMGFYPERRGVDVVTGAAPVAVALSTLRAVLDTVRVRAARLLRPDPDGFQERRRVGAGRYLTAEDVMRRQPMAASDVFRNLSGIRLGQPNALGQPIQIRGVREAWCEAAFYIDGLPMGGLTTDELDAFLRPRNIVGMEIYSEADVPPQFQRGLTACGSILIWTR